MQAKKRKSNGNKGVLLFNEYTYITWQMSRIQQLGKSMYSMKNILPINRGCACLMLLAVLTGCAGTRPGDPGLASKPNMLFSDSRVFSYQNRLQSQVEPGSALSGGAQPAGGSCCK